MFDLQKMINEIGEATKYEAGKEYNLGKLIVDLSKCNQKKNVEIIKGEDRVTPACFESYRGYYCRLSIDYLGLDEPIKVSEFLKQAKEANGKVFIGYKGGDFLMDEKTPIYVSSYGECEGFKVIGVEEKDDVVEIKTRFDE